MLARQKKEKDVLAFRLACQMHKDFFVGSKYFSSGSRSGFEIFESKTWMEFYTMTNYFFVLSSVYVL